MKNTIRFIGDIHAQFNDYLEIIKGCDKSIQVGDFGVGFGYKVPIVEGEHYFIRGNHDNLEKCKLHPKFIEDGRSESGFFFLGGAFSIDQSLRTEGIDWWANEEMSIVQLNEMIERYEISKPSIMVTHDCSSIATYFPQYKIPTRTGQALDAMYAIHKPKLWVFGHYHQDIDVVINGTRFVCVNRNKFVDIDVGQYID